LRFLHRGASAVNPRGRPWPCTALQRHASASCSTTPRARPKRFANTGLSSPTALAAQGGNLPHVRFYRPSSACVLSPVIPGLPPRHLPPSGFYPPSTACSSGHLATCLCVAALMGFKASGVFGGPCPPGDDCHRAGAGSSLPTEINRTYALPWVTRAAILSSDGCQAPDAANTPLTRIPSFEATGESGVPAGRSA
jgi:hypothetical protein